MRYYVGSARLAGPSESLPGDHASESLPIGSIAEAIVKLFGVGFPFLRFVFEKRSFGIIAVTTPSVRQIRSPLRTDSSLD